MDSSSPDILQRARQRVGELISEYHRHPLPNDVEQELIPFAQREAKPTGLEALLGILKRELEV